MLVLLSSFGEIVQIVASVLAEWSGTCCRRPLLKFTCFKVQNVVCSLNTQHAVCPFSSNCGHQKGILVQTTGARWIICLFGPSSVNLRQLCVKILVAAVSKIFSPTHLAPTRLFKFLKFSLFNNSDARF
ncbi:hypothetical protein XENOCAPTIV_010386 [Xenoophorus captivus]|uniref:Secreted protein n=1 Tax=Xenoophorus captivus TaxID=1517983 RepID=A0ABV0QCZ7_9TELE